MQKVFFIIIGIIFIIFDSYSQKMLNVVQGEDYLPFVIEISQEAMNYIKIVDHCEVDNSFVTNSNEVNEIVCKDDNIPLFYYTNEVILTEKGLFVFNKEDNIDLWQIFFVRQNKEIPLDSISVSVLGDSTNIEGSVIEIISFYKEKPCTKIEVKKGKVSMFSFKERKQTYKKINPYLFLPKKQMKF
jgi:hypothetical protein